MNIQAVWALFYLLAKSELRSKRVLVLSFILSLTLAFLTQMAFEAGPAYATKMFSGGLWLVVLFVSIIAQTHLQNLSAKTQFEPGLYYAGMSGFEIFIAKFLFALVFILWVALISGASLFLFGNLFVPFSYLELLVLIVLVSINLAALQTLLFSIFNQIPSKVVLLPLVLYPSIAPILITAIVSTKEILQAQTPQSFAFLTGSALIIGSASAFLFEWVVEELM